MGLVIRNGELRDSNIGELVGKVVDKGIYGVEVRNPLGYSIGTIQRGTMCGGTFLNYRPANPLLRSPSPFGGGGSVFGR